MNSIPSPLMGEGQDGGGNVNRRSPPTPTLPHRGGRENKFLRPSKRCGDTDAQREREKLGFASSHLPPKRQAATLGSISHVDSVIARNRHADHIAGEDQLIIDDPLKIEF